VTRGRRLLRIPAQHHLAVEPVDRVLLVHEYGQTVSESLVDGGPFPGRGFGFLPCAVDTGTSTSCGGGCSSSLVDREGAARAAWGCFPERYLHPNRLCQRPRRWQTELQSSRSSSSSISSSVCLFSRFFLLGLCFWLTDLPRTANQTSTLLGAFR
jgi:hypothetical protein